MPDQPQPQIALGEAIRYIREREGLTQEEVAFQAGVHPTFISRVERGHQDARWSSLCRIAAGLGVSVLELVAISERTELD
jgi:transcriptional regulator with XRE-family HTH domain